MQTITWIDKKGILKMNFETQAVQLLINKMFEKNAHFSICDLNTLGDMIGVNPRNHPDYKYLCGIHCVDYSDMTDAFRQELQRRVANCLKRNQHMNDQLNAIALMAEGNDFCATEDALLITSNK